MNIPYHEVGYKVRNITEENGQSHNAGNTRYHENIGQSGLNDYAHEEIIILKNASIQGTIEQKHHKHKVHLYDHNDHRNVAPSMNFNESPRYNQNKFKSKYSHLGNFRTRHKDTRIAVKKSKVLKWRKHRFHQLY